jgi:hypothetical protein
LVDVATCAQEHFRIHPKGTGAICVQPEGIKAHEFVTEYLGEPPEQDTSV